MLMFAVPHFFIHIIPYGFVLKNETSENGQALPKCLSFFLYKT